MMLSYCVKDLLGLGLTSELVAMIVSPQSCHCSSFKQAHVKAPPIAS